MAGRKKGRTGTKSQRAGNGRAKSAKHARKNKLRAKKKRRAATSKSAKTRQRSERKSPRIYTHKEGVTSEPESAQLRGGQSGDLQGLRNIEGADSESVDELLEEGNAFEADVVAGVERADEDERQEVRAHEVAEDDVPEEYLDKDK